MKGFKFFSILIVAAILLAPAVAEARGPRVSFSFNFCDPFFPCFVEPLPPPPPPMPIFVPYQPAPYIERQTIVREYHYSCCCPYCQAEAMRPRCPCYHQHCR